MRSSLAPTCASLPGAIRRSNRWPRDALARFDQAHPDVQITYEPQPSDYGTKLLAQITAGSPPDVFYLDVDLPYQLIPNHVLLDLTPALTEVGSNTVLVEETRRQ